MSYATPIKCLDRDDTSSQLKLEGWLYIIFIVHSLPFSTRRHRIVLETWEEVGGVSLFKSKTTLEVGWSFNLWSKLYLEGWASRSSYFIGVALFFYSSNLVYIVDIGSLLYKMDIFVSDTLQSQQLSGYAALKHLELTKSLKFVKSDFKTGEFSPPSQPNGNINNDQLQVIKYSTGTAVIFLRIVFYTFFPIFAHLYGSLGVGVLRFCG